MFPDSTQPHLREEKQVSHTREATQIQIIKPAWTASKSYKYMSKIAAETFSSILGYIQLRWWRRRLQKRQLQHSFPRSSPSIPGLLSVCSREILPVFIQNATQSQIDNHGAGSSLGCTVFLFIDNTKGKLKVD